MIDDDETAAGANEVLLVRSQGNHSRNKKVSSSQICEQKLINESSHFTAVFLNNRRN